MRKLITIDVLVKEYKGNANAAANAVGIDYFKFWRWYRRKVYAPANSDTRKAAARKGLELPYRPTGETK